MVVRSVPSSRDILLTLLCGHTVPRTGGMLEAPMHNRGKDKTCAACEKTYISYMTGSAVFEFCQECRLDFDISTPDEAELVLGYLEMTPPEGRKAMVEEMKHKRGKKGYRQQAPRQLAPAAPPADPALIRAAVRAMTTYGTIADDRGPCPSATEYVIAKNGLFEVRHSDIATITLPAKEVIGVETVLTPGVHLKLPRIPFEMLRQTVAFFKEVCDKRNNAEAFVRIWWNRVEERFEIRCPEQRVSGGSVNHSDDFDQDASGDWLIVMDIHSHNTMGAFWSGVDDADEKKAPEGRLFGVIGKVPSFIPEWKWRMRSRDGFIDMNMADIFEGPTQPLPFTVDFQTVLRVLTENKVDAQGRISLSCPINPFQDATFPSEWMARVQTHAATGFGYSRSWHGRGGAGTSEVISGTLIRDQFIFILNEKSQVLEEYKVDGQRKLTPTGFSLNLETRH